jgi:hypothetical protein
MVRKNPVAKNAFRFNKCIAYQGKREKIVKQEKKELSKLVARL